MPSNYDTIGNGYRQTRSADPRIVNRIVDLLNLPPGSRILDVGAGTGTYAEALADLGYQVTALEPSRVMRDQAAANDGIEWIEGRAEELPFDSRSYDGAILILCVHHFADFKEAMAEVQRVVVSSGPILIFTHDPDALEKPWLFEYFPEFRAQIQESFPTVSAFAEVFETDIACIPFHLPGDLQDGFVGAAWRTPERYLDAQFRDGTSAFRQLDPDLCQSGLAALAADLESGDWDQRHGHLRSLSEYDHGYVFIVAGGGVG